MKTFIAVCAIIVIGIVVVAMDRIMRDASRVESNSVNSYVNSISVDTGMRFYNQSDAAHTPKPEEVEE